MPAALCLVRVGFCSEPGQHLIVEPFDTLFAAPLLAQVPFLLSILLFTLSASSPPNILSLPTQVPRDSHGKVLPTASPNTTTNRLHDKSTCSATKRNPQIYTQY
ncbi:uncharacterized protein FMAN_15356 [Fusarium mangiferae]|uniref:Uncharacterized protein n=1 Tax=Fusarium mangiferae TaxID=192010 RepID=A0A1L7UA29_FUSMA|nr:uncharacterized protein FMAN_15356 [Fusarium mangiferae]CVL07259.1 uncharacterized protein FMAN_15356 [Fusarium mangiferae]